MGNVEPLTVLSSFSGENARESLADMVYRILRDAIANGTFAPGFRLREAALARHFGVSTTPIRQALHRLAHEGLVEVSPNRGATVARIDLHEILNLYEIREVLECRAMRSAASVSERDFAPIEANLSSVEFVLNEPDQVEFNRLDIEFHRLMNRLSGNIPLAEFVEQVQRRIQRIRVRCAVYLPGRPTVSHAQHCALLAAVRSCDADQAEALIAEHLQSIREEVVQVLDSIAKVEET